MRFLILAAAALLLLLPMLPAATSFKIIGSAYADDAAPKAKTDKKIAKSHTKKKKEKVEYLRAAPMK